MEGGFVIFNSTCFDANIAQCTTYDIEILPFVDGKPYDNLQNSDEFLVLLGKDFKIIHFNLFASNGLLSVRRFTNFDDRDDGKVQQ